MTIEASGQDVDFTILPKRLVKDAVLSKENFEELFYKFVGECSTYKDAYEKAEEVF
jgi:hypothetical protein